MTIGRSRAGTRPPRVRFLAPPQRGKPGCDQVAAVCYRIRNPGIEFLLVRTRKGRWTFPKGGVELDLTRSQTAALEAFEEAGVHGRIEEVSFAQYSRRKRTHESMVVHAYLCEVLRLDRPQEPNRNRTWFSPEEAQCCLKKDRTPDNGAELARVVERAVARIERLQGRTPAAADPLQKVQFEACEVSGVGGRMAQAALIQYIRGGGGQWRDSGAVKFDVSTYLPEGLRFNRAHQLNAAPLTAEKAKRQVERNRAPGYVVKVPRLVEGSSVAAGVGQNHRVIQINKPRKIRGS